MSANFLSINLNNILIINCPSDVANYLDQEFQRHKKELESVTVVVLTLHGEASIPTQWNYELQMFINTLNTHNPELKIILVLNSWYKVFNLHFNLVEETIYIDFFLLRTYYETVVTNLLRVANWDPTEGKILLLLGRRFIRFHRLRLLYKLINAGLSKQLNWSLVTSSPLQIQDCIAYIPELSANEMELFLKKNHRELDNYVPATGGPQTVQYDLGLYQHSIFQIIAETDFDRCWPTAWITEKTWTSIANKRPFIIAGNVDTLLKLETMGFRTFAEYLKIPNYDSPSDTNFLTCSNGKTFQSVKSNVSWNLFYQNIRDVNWPVTVDYNSVDQLPDYIRTELLTHFKLPIESIDELRLDAIVENASDLLKNIHKFTKQINIDVEYNYNRFVELGKQNLSNIKNIMSRYNLSGEVTDFMNITTL